MSLGAEAQAYMGRGGAPRWVITKVELFKVSQQAQNGQGHEMVESVEQQIARAMGDGITTHQTATLAAATRED